MLLMAVGFYYQDQPVQINRILDFAIGTHHFTTNGKNGSVPALIIRARDEDDKLITQAFALDKITSEVLRVSLRDLDD
jgi:hypothetical protein